MQTNLCFQTMFILMFTYVISLVFAQKVHLKNYIKGRKVKTGIKIKLCILIIFSALPYSILSGCRGFNVGYDTSNYILSFIKNNCSSFELYRKSFSDSFGDYLLQRFCHLFEDNNPFLYLFFMCLLAMLNIIVALFLFGEYKVHLECLLIYYLVLSPTMLDQSRQFIAVGIFGVALYCLINTKIKKFLFFVLVGGLFHSSIFIIFISILPFVLFNNLCKNRKKLIFIIICLTAFLPSLIKLISPILPSHYRYIYLNMQIEEKGLGLGGIFDLMPTFFILFSFYYLRYFKKKKNLDEYYILETTSLLTIPFRIAGYFSFFIARLAYYGQLASIILFSIVIIKASKTDRKIFVFIELIICFVYFYIYSIVWNFHGVVPYEVF